MSKNKHCVVGGNASTQNLQPQPSVPSFTSHQFIKRQQAKAFNVFKQSLLDKQDHAILQIYFSENHTTQWQDETQSAH